MAEQLNIALAPNDDGFGTSAWVVALAHELARQEAVGEVVVIVTEQPWARFHHDKYGRYRNIRPVVLPADCNNIIVAKNRAGTVDVAQTVERCILGYPQGRWVYGEAVAAVVDFSQLDLVVDLGVPQLVRAAHAAGRPTVTLFDHAWSLSLAKIAGYQHLTPEVGVCLDEMRLDEGLTEQVILFEEPVCPPVYHNYWAELVEPVAKLLRGGIGGPLCTLDMVGHPQAAELRNAFVPERQLPAEAYPLARTAARRLLGIDEKRPTLFISGGGTAVWDDLLTALFDSWAARPPSYQVVTYNPAEAARRGVALRPYTVDGCTLMCGRWGDHITFIGPLVGQSHQPLFPAFDLVVTRAGGGTVNNALTARVPLLLVEETGMWQVEQIRQSCLRLGIAEGVTLTEFKAQGRGCWETAEGELRDFAAQREALSEWGCHGEIKAVERMINEL